MTNTNIKICDITEKDFNFYFILKSLSGFGGGEKIW